MGKRNFLNNETVFMSPVEYDHLEAKTTAISHTNKMNWIKTIFSIAFGFILILIGMIKYLYDSTNVVNIAVIMAGVFLMTAIKPSLKNIVGISDSE